MAAKCPEELTSHILTEGRQSEEGGLSGEAYMIVSVTCTGTLLLTPLTFIYLHYICTKQ